MSTVNCRFSLLVCLCLCFMHNNKRLTVRHFIVVVHFHGFSSVGLHTYTHTHRTSSFSYGSRSICSGFGSFFFLLTKTINNNSSWYFIWFHDFQWIFVLCSVIVPSTRDGYGDGDKEWKQKRKNQALNEILYGLKLKNGIEYSISTQSTHIAHYFIPNSLSTTINFLSFIFHAYVIVSCEMRNGWWFWFWFWLKRINCLFAWTRVPSVQLWHWNCTINLKTVQKPQWKEIRNDCIQSKLVLCFVLCVRFASVLISNYENVYAIESSWVVSCVESSLEIEILWVFP